MSQVPSHISALGLHILPEIQAIRNGSEFPISELPEEVNFAERKIEGINPLNPETAVKSKTRKPRKMSQVVVAPVVAEVPAPAKKLTLKMKKMMTEQIPVIPKKIEMDFQQSAGGSVSQQASQMSQEFNQYGSIEMNFSEPAVAVAVVPEPEVKKIKTIRPRVKKVSPAPVPAPVAEIVEELVARAVEESEYQAQIRANARSVIEEKRAKAKASREKTKAKKLALAQVAQVAHYEPEGSDEEPEGKEEGEYERSTPKRPIQKSKEGRVLTGKVDAVEKKVKKELKVLKTPLAELLKKYKTEEKIEEKREEFIQEKKEAISKIHHAIAKEFNTSVVVARRSEAGKGEKKNFASKGVQLKDKTTEKLFWANCERVLPHFVENFTTFASAKKEFKDIENWCFADESNPDFTVEKRAEAYQKFRSVFARATEALVADTCDVVQAEKGDQFSPDSMSKRLILATHLSVQGIYVVRRLEKTLVLRSSRDEVIEMGNANEVMSVVDLVHHRRGKVHSLGEGILRKLCGAVEKKKEVVAHEPSEE